MELAKELGATLHVVSVYQAATKGALRITEMTGVYPGLVDTLSIADSLLEGIASLGRTQGVETHTYAVTGTVAERIVAVAEEKQVELIVVGNKGMKGAKRILGSVPNAGCTCRVVRGSHPQHDLTRSGAVVENAPSDT